MNNVKHRINQHIVKVSFKSAVVGVKRGGGYAGRLAIAQYGEPPTINVWCFESVLRVNIFRAQI